MKDTDKIEWTKEGFEQVKASFPELSPEEADALMKNFVLNILLNA
jgi:hypothetical protein